VPWKLLKRSRSLSILDTRCPGTEQPHTWKHLQNPLAKRIRLLTNLAVSGLGPSCPNKRYWQNKMVPRPNRIASISLYQSMAGASRRVCVLRNDPAKTSPPNSDITYQGNTSMYASLAIPPAGKPANRSESGIQW